MSPGIGELRNKFVGWCGGYPRVEENYPTRSVSRSGGSDANEDKVQEGLAKVATGPAYPGVAVNVLAEANKRVG